MMGMIYDSVMLGNLARGLLNPIGEMNKYFENFFNTADLQINVDYSFNQNIKNFSPREFSEDIPYLNKASLKVDFSFKY